jgi:hypothetical protein
MMRQVNCRILIDVFGYNKHHLAKGFREDDDPYFRRNIVSGTGLRGQQSQPLSALPVTQSYVKLKYRDPVLDGDGSRSNEPKSNKRLSEDRQASNKKTMLSKETDLMFLGPLLEGYALKNKLWRKHRLARSLGM